MGRRIGAKIQRIPDPASGFAGLRIYGSVTKYYMNFGTIPGI
jgi:hypothetical protein